MDWIHLRRGRPHASTQRASCSLYELKSCSLYALKFALDSFGHGWVALCAYQLDDRVMMIDFCKKNCRSVDLIYLAMFLMKQIMAKNSSVMYDAGERSFCMFAQYMGINYVVLVVSEFNPI